MFILALALKIRLVCSLARGFSINKDVIGTNMLERSIVAQRTVCDWVAYMLEGDGNSDPKAIHKLAMHKDMLKYCRGARMRYENYLKVTRNETKNEKEKAKEKSKSNELTRERNKVVSLEKMCRSF